MTDVVVVNYRTPEDLETFCQSIAGQERDSLTIANNAPRFIDTEVAQMIAEQMDAQVITNAENVGYAKAVNEAVAKGSAPVIAIFNADVVVPPGSLGAMSNFVMEHSDVGVAGPKQVDSDGRITHGGITGSNRRPKLRGWHQRDHGQVNDVLLDAVSVSGSAFFVRRECWDELTSCVTYQDSVEQMLGAKALGAFLPTPHYYEETACTYHARAHGWKVAYNGAVKMIHQWRGASKDSSQLTIYAHQSRKMFRQFCDAHGIECD